MSALLAFSASCQRGHDLETLTDRKAFEAHMTKGHKARKPSPAKGPGPRKGGLPAKYLTPNRAPRGTEGLTKVLLEVDHWCDAASPGRGIFAGVDDDWTTAERVSPDQLDSIVPTALYAVSSHTAGELSPAFAGVRTSLVALRDADRVEVTA